MTESNSCINAKASLHEIQLLKQEFHQTYIKGIDSRDETSPRDIREAKQRLLEKIYELKKLTWPVEAERLFQLKEQYQFQKNLLKENGFLHSKHETLSIKGINGKDYPLPSLEEIVVAMSKDPELYKLKADQGFTTLLLVPFGMSLGSMSEKLKLFLHKYRNERKLLATIHATEPLRVLNGGYSNLVYDPRALRSGAFTGTTKEQILQQQEEYAEPCIGWRVILVQTPRDTNSAQPALQEEQTRGSLYPRTDIATGKSADTYLKTIAHNSENDPAYEGEYGMTPEEWIIHFLTRLASADSEVSPIFKNESASTILTGAYSATFKECPSAIWDQNEKKAFLSSTTLDDEMPYNRTRTVVRI